MMFNGLRNFKNLTQLLDTLQPLGITFGPHLNAYTSWHETVYMLTLPAINENPQLVPLCFTIMRDFMDGALLTPEEVDMERGIILNEINQRASIRMELNQALTEFLIPNTIYAKNGRYDIGGSNKSIIETIPQSEFVEFYAEYYTPNRMTFVITGDITNVTDMIHTIETTFGNMTNPTENPGGKEPDYGTVELHDEADVDTDEEDLLRSVVVSNDEFEYNEIYLYNQVKMYSNKYDHPDTIEQRIYDIQLDIVNNVLWERFEKRKLEENSPISFGNSVNFFYDTGSVDESLTFEFSYVTVDHVEGKLKDGIFALEQEYRKMMLYGITQSEFQNEIYILINNYEEAVERKSTRDSNAIARRLVDTISSNRVYSTPETNLDILLNALDNKQITPESCHEYFKEYWGWKNQTSSSNVLSLVYFTKDVVVANIGGLIDLDALQNANATTMGEEGIPQKAVVDDFRTELLKEYYLESQRTVEVLPPEDFSNVTFAYTTDSFGEPGTVVSDTYVEDLEIRQLILSNNVRVNLKRTNFADNSISLKAEFGNGLLSMPLGDEFTGLDWFATTMINDGGLGLHSLDEISRLTAGYSVGWMFDIDFEFFTLNGNTNPDDLLLQLQLFVAMLTDPGYREEALRQFQFEIPARISNLQHTLNGPFTQSTYYMRGGDSRFGIPDANVLMGFTPDIAKEWLQPQFSNTYLEFSIVGDIPDDDESVVLDYILKTIGTLPTRDDTPIPSTTKKFNHDIVFPINLPQTHTLTYDSDTLTQAAAVLAWETIPHLPENINITRSINILSAIYQDRCRVEIREKLGATYTTRAISRSLDGFSHGEFITYAIVEPTNVTLVLNTMKDIAVALVNDGITDDEELLRGIKPFITNLDDTLTSNSYWLNSVVSLSQLRPYQLDWSRNRNTYYDTITTTIINDLAKQFLNIEKSLAFKMLPEIYVPQPMGVRNRQMMIVNDQGGNDNNEMKEHVRGMLLRRHSNDEQFYHKVL